jgi:hypothetical protein
MSMPEGSPPSRATRRAQMRSLCRRAVRVVTMSFLALTLALAGAPTALAGPQCPDKPGVCPG